ncbi:hypothetical protein HN709_01070 [Candidatus Peregrinibacteria bacterium]|jgi:hypothetical protein|nr:hypothetical protein [Candidatus Peregrinibacteria bacterium]MBT7736255.1 hypothetical protein [Candidatus Peregrinibacteria bacterium]
MKKIFSLLILSAIFLSACSSNFLDNKNDLVDDVSISYLHANDCLEPTVVLPLNLRRDGAPLVLLENEAPFYLTAHVNDRGNVGDALSYEIFYEKLGYDPTQKFGRYWHEGWELLDSSESLNVVEGCNGNLYAHFKFYPYGSGPIHGDPVLRGDFGKHLVQIYSGDELVESMSFWLDISQ